MPIIVTCSCGTRLNAPDAAAGRKVKCPKCGAAVSVPGGVATASSPPAASAPAASAPRPAPARNPAPPSAPRPAPARAPAAPSAPRQAAPRPAAAAPPARAPKVEEPVPEADEVSSSGWDSFALLQHSEWTIKLAQWFPLNIRNRHYNFLLPNTKTVIGRADEKAGAFILMLRAMKLFERMLPTRVEVREEEGGPLLMAVRRGFRVFPLPVTVQIFDDQGNKMGYFQTKIFSLLGGFWLYDADGKEVAEVKAKIGLPPRYLFLSKDGRELGSITTDALAKTTGPSKKKIVFEMGRPGLRLKVKEEMSEEPNVKVLMLAVALALEFTGVADRFLLAK